MKQHQKDLLAELFSERKNGTLIDILIVGYHDPRNRDQKITKRSPTPENVRGSPGIIPNAEHLSLQDIGKLFAGPKAGFANTSSTLRKLRETLLNKVSNVKEKLNPKGGYLGYRSASSDRVYIYVQSDRLVIDVRRPRTIEPMLKKADVEITHRDNYQGKQGWTTGIQLLHDAPVRQIELVASEIVYALSD